MSNLLVGSQALKYWLGEKFDPDRDIDIIAEKSGREGSVEFISVELLNNRAFFNLDGPTIDLNSLRVTVAPLWALYVMKRSHLHRPLKFARHIQQFQIIKKLVTLTSEQQKLLDERTKLTKKEYGDRTPSLNKTNEEFFDDYVTKYYVHDDIHKMVAYYDQPIYTKLKTRPELALCEKELWDFLPLSDKIKCVQEECYVIALERKIIPSLIRNQNHMLPKHAFYYALERVCTTLTGGWFRDFAIDNWQTIVDTQIDFYGKFLEEREKYNVISR